jgi:hypothetical protein
LLFRILRLATIASPSSPPLLLRLLRHAALLHAHMQLISIALASSCSLHFASNVSPCTPDIDASTANRSEVNTECESESERRSGADIDPPPDVANESYSEYKSKGRAAELIFWIDDF